MSNGGEGDVSGRDGRRYGWEVQCGRWTGRKTTHRTCADI